MSYLKASDIARELSCSRSEAYEIMKEMPHLKHGKTVRVESIEFERWKALSLRGEAIAVLRTELRSRHERARVVLALVERAIDYLESGKLYMSELGFVYFARSMRRGVKVGFSTDPVARLEVHSRDEALVPLLIIPGSFALERFVHVAFAPWLIAGEREWFEPAEQVIAFIGWLAEEIYR